MNQFIDFYFNSNRQNSNSCAFELFISIESIKETLCIESSDLFFQFEKFVKFIRFDGSLDVGEAVDVKDLKNHYNHDIGEIVGFNIYLN